MSSPEAAFPKIPPLVIFLLVFIAVKFLQSLPYTYTNPYGHAVFGSPQAGQPHLHPRAGDGAKPQKASSQRTREDQEVMGAGSVDLKKGNHA